MIDNLEIIKPFLTFENENDFYFVQILKRKKEHPELGSNNYVVKTYYISSLEYLDDKFDEMKVLADFHNARVYINLNKRNYEKCALQTARLILDQVVNKNFKSSRKAFESVVGKYSSEFDKKWIVDIDGDSWNINAIKEYINNLEPNIGENKIIIEIPTKNGIHLITSPFRKDIFCVDHSGIDIHKNNPTILYVP